MSQNSTALMLVGACLISAVSAESPRAMAAELPRKPRSLEEILKSGSPAECRFALMGFLHYYNATTDKMIAAGTRTAVHREQDASSVAIVYALWEAHSPRAIPLLLQRISLWEPVVFGDSSTDWILSTYP